MICQLNSNKNKKGRMEKPPKEPSTLLELLWYVKYYDKHIFVRAQDKTGKWGNVRLADLDPKAWAEKMDAFLARGILPVRVRTSEEMEEDEQAQTEYA